MDERRKLDRKYLIVYSRVFERNLGKMLGYLGDLSLSGVMIISEQHSGKTHHIPPADQQYCRTYNFSVSASWISLPA